MAGRFVGRSVGGPGPLFLICVCVLARVYGWMRAPTPSPPPSLIALIPPSPPPPPKSGDATTTTTTTSSSSTSPPPSLPAEGGHAWRESCFATHLVFGGLCGVFASVALAAAAAGAGLEGARGVSVYVGV